MCRTKPMSVPTMLTVICRVGVGESFVREISFLRITTAPYIGLALLLDVARKQRDGVSGVEEADDVFLHWEAERKREERESVVARKGRRRIVRLLTNVVEHTFPCNLLLWLTIVGVRVDWGAALWTRFEQLKDEIVEADGEVVGKCDCQRVLRKIKEI